MIGRFQWNESKSVTCQEPFPASASTILMRPSPRPPTLHLLLLAAVSVAGEAAAQVPPKGDVARGQMLFQQSCALCHSTGLGTQPATGQGPLLAGVVGRKAAALPNFGYSKALEASGLTWDAGTLDRFLAGPGIMVPGTTMPVPVGNPVDRGDLIAFLATLRPVALPAGSAN